MRNAPSPRVPHASSRAFRPSSRHPPRSRGRARTRGTRDSHCAFACTARVLACLSSFTTTFAAIRGRARTPAVHETAAVHETLIAHSRVPHASSRAFRPSSRHPPRSRGRARTPAVHEILIAHSRVPHASSRAFRLSPRRSPRSEGGRGRPRYTRRPPYTRSPLRIAHCPLRIPLCLNSGDGRPKLLRHPRSEERCLRG